MTEQDPLVTNIYTKVSQRAQYKPPEASHVVDRKVALLQPTISGNYKYNGIKYIRFVLPAQDFLDTQRSYFSFNIQTSPALPAVNTPAVGTTENNNTGLHAFRKGAYMQNYTDSSVFFKRVRILLNSTQIEEIDDYNILQSMFTRYVNDPAMYDSELGRAQGMVPGEFFSFNPSVPSITQCISRELADPDITSSMVFHPSLLGFMSTHQYIPLQFMGEITIELALEDPTVALRTPTQIAGSTNIQDKLDYTISNITYHAEVCRMSITYLSAFEESLAAGAVMLWFSTFQSYTSNIAPSSLADITINHRGRNLKTLMAIFRTETQLSTQTSNKFQFSRNGITDYQVRLGTKLFPDDMVHVGDAATSAVWYAETAKALGFWMNPYHTTCIPNKYANKVAEQNWRLYLKGINNNDNRASEIWPDVVDLFDSPDNNFMICTDFEKEPELMSGEDTASAGVPIYLRIKGTWNTSLQAKVFIHQDIVLMLKNTREIVIQT
jgi:hypothetical protein